jgi:acetylglutamate kinase
VNPALVETLLDEGFIPVISTVALGEDGDSNRYNINADTAAAKIAAALHAEKFVQLTNVPGVLRDVNDSSTLIKQIARVAIPSLMATGIISAGMIPKIECCLEALKGGVPRTHIIDGRVPHSLLIEMFSDRGVGTMIL